MIVVDASGPDPAVFDALAAETMTLEFTPRTAQSGVRVVLGTSGCGDDQAIPARITRKRGRADANFDDCFQTLSSPIADSRGGNRIRTGRGENSSIQRTGGWYIPTVHCQDATLDGDRSALPQADAP